MKKPSFEETMVSIYKETIKAILISQLKDDKELLPLFHSKSIEEQRDIETEIDKQSERSAVDLVANLKKKGYLEKEPDEKELEKIIVATLKEHGFKK